jgi:rare lipoprotein A
MKRTVLSTLLCAGLTSCAFGPALAGDSTGPYVGQVETCEASWYGPGFDGKPMKKEEIPYDSNHPGYVAHSTLPMGTIIKVTNLNNDLSVEVEVADRGPNGISGRCVDATRAVAKMLKFYVNERAGEAPVLVEILELPKM